MCGLASSAFARHYLRNHGCFLFLWVLRCFTSPRSLLLPYVFRQRSPDITPVSFEVSLFGNPRIEARLPDRKSTRLNSSHGYISYAVFCLKKKNVHNQL